MTMSGSIKDRELAKFTEVDGETTIKVYSMNSPVDLSGYEILANKSNDTALTDDSAALFPTQHAVKTYVDSKVESVIDTTQEPTGFIYPDEVIVSYDGTARTVTITGNTEAYFKGEIVSQLVSGWTSDPHDSANGLYFLRYNGTSFSWGTTPWVFSDLMIAIVFRDGAIFCLRECHGLMQWQTHKEFHEITGTYLTSGGDLSNYKLSSTTPTDRRPYISQATIYDEDLKSVLASLSTNAYSWLYLSGANYANITTDNAEIINLTGNQPYYNQFTGGVWQQTAMTNNHYAKIFVMAIPATVDTECYKKRFMFIQPQTTNLTLSIIQGLAPSSINLGHISSALAEYVFIGEIIIRYTGANWQFISVSKLTGTRYSQASTPSGSFLSSVSTTTNFTGNGTAGDPLNLSGLTRKYTEIGTPSDGYQGYNPTNGRPVYYYSGAWYYTHDNSAV